MPAIPQKCDAPKLKLNTDCNSRSRFERLIRYAARPAVATERLSALPDGRLLYRLKRSWRDGTSAVIFERQELMAKLAVLVPAARAHLTRYHGILGPAAVWRSLIIPTGGDENSGQTLLDAQPSSPPSTGPTAPVMGAEPAPQTPSARKRELHLGRIDEKSFPGGRSSMSTLRRPHENSRRNTSARRDTKTSGVSGAAFPRPAPGASRLRPHRADGLVLNVAVTTLRDRCVSACQILP